MTPIRKKPAASAEAKAREWFVRILDDDVSEEDLIAWSQWLEASPANRAAYESVESAWTLAGEADVARPSDKALIRDAYCPTRSVASWRTAQRVKKRVAWSAGPIAATLLLCAFVWVSRDAAVAPGMTLATARAEDLRTKLADGSQVHLGAMTTLQVAYRKRARAIDLVRGEALFEVAHDRSRPFVVSTPLGTVTAVGTAFNVDVQTDAVVLTVTEGSVSVAPMAEATANRSPPESGLVLSVGAGERVQMRKSGPRLSVMRDASPIPPTWSQGRLEYRDEPLRSVLEDVNRYAARPIVIQDPEVGELAYTGTIQLDNTDDWARGLSAAFGLTVDLDRRQQFVLRKAPPRLDKPT